MTAPDPLVSSSIDLRDFGYMPLDVVRLRDSDLASESDAVFRVAVLSWCVSWHQVPAASLPDDDPILARLLGFGRDLRGWKKVRAAGGLRGWVLCSDGRLYHPVVAEKATEAWTSKQSQRQRTEAARLSLQRKRTTVTDYETASKGREGRGEERNGEGESPARTPSVDRAHASGEGDDLIGAAPDYGEPIGDHASAPTDLAADLRPLWGEIARDHGHEVATRARDATKRIFGAVTPNRMRETFAAAFEDQTLALAAVHWRDFRDRIKSDRAGLTGAPTGPIDPEREAARQRSIDRRTKGDQHVTSG